MHVYNYICRTVVHKTIASGRRAVWIDADGIDRGTVCPREVSGNRYGARWKIPDRLKMRRDKTTSRDNGRGRDQPLTAGNNNPIALTCAVSYRGIALRTRRMTQRRT